jgi:arylsulfatase A-like enzyme
VLLVTIDTLRADRVGAYGAKRPVSPNLDALAARGILYEKVYAPTGTTCPSHATLFTSRSPLAHGLVRNGMVLHEEERTLPELLRDAGWQTAGFVSSYPLKRRFGFAQGFDHYDDGFEGSDATMSDESWEGVRVEGTFDRRGSDTVDVLLAWLDARIDERPLFVWLHLFDPHSPYDAPRAFRARSPARADKIARETAAYEAEIAYADTQVGRAIDAFERASGLEAPLLVVTSDHGEGLWDHGWPTHNRYLYEEELRVPWIAAWEGRLPAGTRVGQPAHLIDVAPTLAGWLGLDTGAVAFDGVDLGGASGADPERSLWLQRPYYESGRPDKGERGWGFGVRAGRWKLIEAADEGRRELYDLEFDPGERTNLAASQPGRAEVLSRSLAAWREAELEKARPGVLRLDAGDVEALRALGYLDPEEPQ